MFLNMIACKCFITFPSAPGPCRDLRSSLQLFVRKYATDMPRESLLYKLSFNSNCLAWPLRLDDVINKLLKRLLVSFKPIVNSLGLMDHFNCNALGENWIFAQRIGTDTMKIVPPFCHRDLAEPLLGVYAL